MKNLVLLWEMSCDMNCKFKIVFEEWVRGKEKGWSVLMEVMKSHKDIDGMTLREKLIECF